MQININNIIVMLQKKKWDLTYKIQVVAKSSSSNTYTYNVQCTFMTSMEKLHFDIYTHCNLPFLAHFRKSLAFPWFLFWRDIHTVHRGLDYTCKYSNIYILTLISHCTLLISANLISRLWFIRFNDDWHCM